MPDEPDPKKKLTPEEIYQALKPLHDALVADVENTQRIYDAVEKDLGRIAREHFPGMSDYWQAEQFRELADLISRTASDFCVQLSNVDYHAIQSKG
jgi:hypothetical protein